MVVVAGGVIVLQYILVLSTEKEPALSRQQQAGAF
jgi:hypothetical protein